VRDEKSAQCVRAEQRGGEAEEAQMRRIISIFFDYLPDIIMSMMFFTLLLLADARC